MSWNILEGDVRQRLADMSPQSVHVSVCSPPYHGLRAYGTQPQIFEGACCEHPHEWVEHVKPAANGIVNGGMSGDTLSGASATRNPTSSWSCAHLHEWGEPLPPRPGRGNKPGDLSTSALTNPERQDEVTRPTSSGQYCTHTHEWGEPVAGNPRGGSGTPNGRNGMGEGYGRDAERGQFCNHEHRWSEPETTAMRIRNGAEGGLHDGRATDKLSENVVLNPPGGQVCTENHEHQWIEHDRFSDNSIRTEGRSDLGSDHVRQRHIVSATCAAPHEHTWTDQALGHRQPNVSESSTLNASPPKDNRVERPIEHEHEWTEARPAGYRGSDTNPGALQHEGNVGRERLTSSLCVPCGAWKGELGLEPIADCMAWARGEPPCAACYVCHLRTIFGGADRPQGLWRVLRDDGTFWLNLGDSYSTRSAMRTRGNRDVVASMDGKVELPSWREHAAGGQTRMPSQTRGVKEKDLLGVPWRVVLALQSDGWYWRSTICWAKKACMPESVDDRPTNSWEPIFLLTKSGDTLYWTHRDGLFPGSRTKPKPDYVYVDRGTSAEQREEPADWQTELLAGSKTRKRWRRLNLWEAHDYYYDAAAVRDGNASAPHAPGNRGDDAHAAPRNKFENGRTGHILEPDRVWGAEGGRNMRNVMFAPEGVALNQWWLLGPEPTREEHYAAWPTAIARKAIMAGSSEKGVCPKCGAPWQRVERSQSASSDAERAWQGVPLWQSNRDGAQEPKKRGAVGTPLRTDNGWTPTCGCKCTECAGMGKWLADGDGDPAYMATIPIQMTCKTCEGTGALKTIPATVIDPFAGSGTTLLVADRLGRHGVGIELLPKYVEMMRRRLESDAPLLNLLPEVQVEWEDLAPDKEPAPVPVATSPHRQSGMFD